MSSLKTKELDTGIKGRVPVLLGNKYGAVKYYFMCRRINLRWGGGGRSEVASDESQGGTIRQPGEASSLFTVHGGNIGQECSLNTLSHLINVYMHAHVDCCN